MACLLFGAKTILAYCKPEPKGRILDKFALIYNKFE